MQDLPAPGAPTDAVPPEAVTEPDPSTRRSGLPLALRVLPVLLALFAVGAAVKILSGDPASASSFSPSGATSAYRFTAGTPAPGFTLKSLDGRDVSLSDFRGKTVLLNFWATWCPPCRSEMPDMQRVANDFPNELVVLAVDLQEAPDPIAAFVKQFGLTFPILLDTKGDVSQAYGVQSLPSSFFIDAEGRISSFNLGALNESAIRRRLQQARG